MHEIMGKRLHVKFYLEVSAKDVAAVCGFYEEWKNSPLVKRRVRRNIHGERELVDEALAWKAMEACLLTTQQRSGPQSAVAQVIRARPFPLELTVARSQPRIEAWVVSTLRRVPGIRRYHDIARSTHSNFTFLESGGWVELIAALRTLERPHKQEDERSVAHLVDQMLVGFGPKQARNMLQMLGLTQYEIPLDSRVAKWLKAFGFPAPVSPAALADSNFYDFVMDGFQQIATAANLVPCALDAAIFASFDPAWPEYDAVF